jgi:hypothetical protein
MSRFRRIACLVPCAAALVCCSFVLDPAETQCETDQDCATRGPAFAGARCVQSTCQIQADPGIADAGGEDVIDKSDPLWCLGTFRYVQPDPNRRMQLVQRFVRQTTQEPIGPGEATIKLCARSDLPCSEPRQIVEPDADGFVRVDVEYGFSGYFDFTAPDLQSSIMVVNPLINDLERPPLQALSPTTAAFLAQTLLGEDVKLEPTLAHSILAVFDCNGNRFSGISYQAAVVDAQNRTRVFYIRNAGVPTPGGTETNEQGQGGFINLPPGIGTISGTYNVQQKKVVSIDLPLRAGYFSYASLRPEEFQ